MGYLAAFFEGIITFVSPCLLPLLPVYLAFFAGGDAPEHAEHARGSSLLRALAFVVGFAVPFMLMGAGAGAVGSMLVRYRRLLEAVCGLIVMAFGLSYLGVLPQLFSGVLRPRGGAAEAGLGSALLFGATFAVAWTPCVGTFLASALSLAASSGSVATGVAMLGCYSVGLGVPFVLAALLMDELQGAFDWIKGHYELVNRCCGTLLVAVGLLMAVGLFGSWMRLLG